MSFDLRSAPASIRLSRRPGARLGAGLLIAGLIGLVSMPLGGCMTVKRMNGRALTLANAELADASQPYVVQVENQLGSVRIFGNPDLKKPEVYAIATDPVIGTPGVRTKQPTAAELQAWVAASVETTGEGKVLRVLSADPNLEKRPVLLNIFVPSITGVVVRNTGGHVHVRNVSGPVQIFNGLTTGNGGDVLVDTDAAINGPLSVKARGGDVTVRVGAGSVGKLDIQGKLGAFVDAPERSITGIRATPTTYRAEVGNAGQDFKVQSEDGKATVLIKPAK